MPIDPTELAKSIGAIGTLDPERGLAPTLQQIVLAAKQLFEADAAGLMLIDQNGQLRWASASDQTAQALEDGQERLAQGPCLAAFSQRAPAVIRDISSEPDWGPVAGNPAGVPGCAGCQSAPVARHRLGRVLRRVWGLTGDSVGIPAPGGSSGIGPPFGTRRPRCMLVRRGGTPATGSLMRGRSHPLWGGGRLADQGRHLPS
jgi:hypothetical protein